MTEPELSGLELLESWRARWAERMLEEELAGRFGVPPDLTPLRSTLTAVIDTDPTAMRDADLQACAARLEHARRLLDAASFGVLAELDVRGSTDTDRGLRTGPWLADTTGLPSGVARARVRLAREVSEQLPEVAVALGEGRVGEHHARALAAAAANPRLRDELAPMIPDLIDDAETLSFDVWRAKLAALVSLLDADGPEPEDPTAENTVAFTRGLDGRWILRGEFDPITGAVIRDAVTARANSLFHARRRDEEQAPGDLLAPSHRQLLAQGMHDMARADHAERHTGAGPAPEMILHLDAADPTQLVDDTGIRIGDTTRHTLTCDPLLRGVVFGLHRSVLDVGDLQRLVTAAQRRALNRRDGGCVFPGCDAPAAWTDAHHVEHWADGGPTDLANLASLCRYHHGVSHRDAWTMGVTHDEWFWWTTPTGKHLWSQRHGTPRDHTPRDGPTPPRAARPAA